MSAPVKTETTRLVKSFKCIGAECEDTCCQGWGMQVDEATYALWDKEAPELKDMVTTGEAQMVMKRNEADGFCVKFADGICSIHRDLGERFLGDACHFYPRIVRKFGETHQFSAAISCPEIARIALYGEGDVFAPVTMEVERIPYTVKDYLLEGVSSEDAFYVMQTLLALAGDESVSAERSVARLLTIANTLKFTAPARWKAGISMLARLADGRLPKPEYDRNDPYLLLNMLIGLVTATRKPERARLAAIIGTMEHALKVVVDRDSLSQHQNLQDYNAANDLATLWNNNAARTMQPILRRWLQTELTMASFPYAGFGADVVERMMIIAVRFALVKLALQAHMGSEGAAPSKEDTVRVVQVLSRFTDHLADPALMVSICQDAGWTSEARVRALVGDVVGAGV